jgi:hypothetical protein
VKLLDRVPEPGFISESNNLLPSDTRAMSQAYFVKILEHSQYSYFIELAAATAASVSRIADVSPPS